MTPIKRMRNEGVIPAVNYGDRPSGAEQRRRKAEGSILRAPDAEDLARSRAMLLDMVEKLYAAGKAVPLATLVRTLHEVMKDAPPAASMPKPKTKRELLAAVRAQLPELEAQAAAEEAAALLPPAETPEGETEDEAPENPGNDW